MRLLAIDTSGPLCSAALLLDGDLTERVQLAPRRHAELILPMMDALLHEAGAALADLDALAYGHGPGSFTGVRIAAAVVQGAAFGAGLPVIGISTLAALAQGAWRLHGVRQVLCAQDARMGEVYWGAYQLDEHDIMRSWDRDRVGAPDRVQRPDGEEVWAGAGSGWQVHAELLAAAVGAVRPLPLEHCHARDVAALAAEGGGVSAQNALPVYLRERVAEPPRH